MTTVNVETERPKMDNVSFWQVVTEGLFSRENTVYAGVMERLSLQGGRMRARFPVLSRFHLSWCSTLRLLRPRSDIPRLDLLLEYRLRDRGCQVGTLTRSHDYPSTLAVSRSPVSLTHAFGRWRR